jgi:hypothetical protein
MVARGFVKDKGEAFERYLARGRSGYAERFRFSAADSISAIRSAGGLAVLAHPFTLGLAGAALGAFVDELAVLGLAGIEVYYSEHSPSQVREFRDIALSRGLLLTGGSDFHGEVNPAVKLGVGFGNLTVNDDLLEKMMEKKHLQDSGKA